MKSAVILSLYLLSFVLLTSCSKDNDDNPQDNPSNAFVLDKTTYTVNIASIAFQDRGTGITDASIVLSGGNGSKTGGISSN